MSVPVVVLWTMCFLVSQTFPMLVERLGSATTFWSYAVVTAVCFVFVLTVVPETKGKTLEQIEEIWTRKLQ
ncbi:MAG: MFS transporter, partial [Pirellulales bacterium]